MQHKLISLAIATALAASAAMLCACHKKPAQSPDEDDSTTTDAQELVDIQRIIEYEEIAYPSSELEVVEVNAGGITADEPKPECVAPDPEPVSLEPEVYESESYKPAQQVNSDNSPLTIAMVEQTPAFPGGEQAMYKWIGDNLNYPAQAAEEGAQGKVIVSFVVEKDGSITNAKVVRGRHPALDEEAIRVINKMPKWSPGRNNGVTVRVSYTLPITFRLQ